MKRGSGTRRQGEHSTSSVRANTGLDTRGAFRAPQRTAARQAQSSRQSSSLNATTIPRPARPVKNNPNISLADSAFRVFPDCVRSHSVEALDATSRVKACSFTAGIDRTLKRLSTSERIGFCLVQRSRAVEHPACCKSPHGLTFQAILACEITTTGARRLSSRAVQKTQPVGRIPAACDAGAFVMEVMRAWGLLVLPS